jgi:hypothetical protein
VSTLQVPPAATPKEETTVTYEVYAFNVPRVTEDGKASIPVERHAPVRTFPTLADAEASMREQGKRFDRVLLIELTKMGPKEEPKLVKRVCDRKEELAAKIVRQ